MDEEIYSLMTNIIENIGKITNNIAKMIEYLPKLIEKSKYELGKLFPLINVIYKYGHK